MLDAAPTDINLSTPHQREMIARRKRQDARVVGFTPSPKKYRKPLKPVAPPTEKELMLLKAQIKEREERAQRALQRGLDRLIAKSAAMHSPAGQQACLDACVKIGRKNEKRVRDVRRALSFDNANAGYWQRLYPWLEV